MLITTRSIRARRRSRAEGQSLVEFALVLTPLFLIMLGIVQFGFIFNAYITITNGDLTVTYVLPGDIPDSNPRTGQTVTVQARYHQDLIIPFISAFLPKDGNGRLVLTGEVTMVIN